MVETSWRGGRGGGATGKEGKLEKESRMPAFLGVVLPGKPGF